MPDLPSVSCAMGSGWKSTTASNAPISPSGEVVRQAPVAKLSWLRVRVISMRYGTSGAIVMAEFSMEVGRQKALPQPRREVPTIALN
jgi:hypothetical protein